MKLQLLPQRFCVCQVDNASQIDWQTPFCFAARTDEECSLVCPEEDVPKYTIMRENGWRAFRIAGVLDFSLVGILARIASLLAEQGIPIYAVSTFNTDYVFVKEELLQTAVDTLSSHGYGFEFL